MKGGIDYLQWVCKGVDGVFVRARLGDVWSAFSQCAGLFGYSVSYRGEGIVVAEGGRDGMGVMVQISGAGCRLVEVVLGEEGWLDWLAMWLAIGAQFSRIDLAWDFEGSACAVAVLDAALSSGSYTSRWVGWSSNTEYGSKQAVKSRSVYLGSITSDSCLAVYDKGLQQSPGTSGEGELTRYELRYKREQAGECVRWLLQEGNWLRRVELLGSALTVREETKDDHVYRRPVAAWWSCLVGEGCNVRIGRPRVTGDFEQRLNAFKQAHGRTLAELAMVWGTLENSQDLLQEIVWEASNALSAQQIGWVSAQVTRLRCQKGVSDEASERAGTELDRDGLPDVGGRLHGSRVADGVVIG